MIDRSAAAPQSRIGADGPVDEFLGAPDRGNYIEALRQPGGDGRGVGAAGAMSMAGLDSFGWELVKSAVEKQVGGGARQMPTFNQDRASPHVAQEARCIAQVRSSGKCECFRD